MTNMKKTRKKSPKKGKALLNQVIKSAGLGSTVFKEELISMWEKKNIDVSQITVDELRCAAASYVREIMGNILKIGTQKKP